MLCMLWSLLNTIVFSLYVSLKNKSYIPDIPDVNGFRSLDFMNSFEVMGEFYGLRV